MDVIIPKGSEETYERLHFAPAVRVADVVYCSGQIGTGADGRLPEKPEQQFRNAFENVKALLEAAGSSLEAVIEMTTFHVGFQEHIGDFMGVKDSYIREPYPAWTAIGISELGFGSLVEIKVTARVG